MHWVRAEDRKTLVTKGDHHPSNRTFHYVGEWRNHEGSV